MSSDQPQAPDGGQNDDFVVDYVKSQYFRVVFAEGFWGNLTLSGKVQIAFWNSREAIPKQVRYNINENNEIEEVGRTVRADQIREVETSVLMDIDSARALREWLDDVIAESESRAFSGESESGAEE